MSTFPGVIKTDRLLLRPYDESDAAEFFALVDSDRERLVESFPNFGNDLTSIEHAQAFILTRVEEWNARRTFCYGIRLKNSGQLIGQLQVKNIQWNVSSAELSYFIASSSSRRGFATEAIDAVLRVAFAELQFARIFVRVLVSNAKSIALSKKLGFRHEGTHRNEFRCGRGKLHDVDYFAIIDRDYHSSTR